MQDEFDFEIGVTPLSTWHALLIIPMYLMMLAGIREHVRVRGKGYDLKTWEIAHNLSLSAASAVLFGDIVLVLSRMVSEEGVFSVYCDTDARWLKGPIYQIYYINYLFKIVELLDTVILALKGRELHFLHVYHHSITFVLCWVQLRGKTSLQFLVIVMNLAVHVVMYLYYALHALNINVWWKKYLTQLQIAQFVIAVVGGTLGYLTFLGQRLGLIDWRCQGEFAAATFGLAILYSYLVLFIGFYQRSYKPPAKLVSAKKPF